MKKFTLLFMAMSINCFAQNVVKLTTGFIAHKTMVVSAREEASKIGVEIMQKGGNAFELSKNKI